MMFFPLLREISKDWQARPLFDDTPKNTDPDAQKGVILVSTYIAFITVSFSSKLFVNATFQSPVSIFALFLKNSLG
jgi:hypothetical protein